MAQRPFPTANASSLKLPEAKKSTGESKGDPATAAYFHHSSAQRINTDVIITQALAAEYPQLQLVVTPDYSPSNLLRFAAGGQATATRVTNDKTTALPSSLEWTEYVPPARRASANGFLGEVVIFGKFLYKWKDDEFILYIANGRDGSEGYPQVVNQYILGPSKEKIDELVMAAGIWGSDLHDEILVFDDGQWMPSTELWQSVQKATWDAVILDEGMKKALIEDHKSFFTSQKTYEDLKVPWKRGIIYHGPPGNGKTISIKATMHMLSDSNPSIPSLYVRSLQSWGGPEYGIRMVFGKAREFAPCYLIFEDLDTIITPDIRSYFLNEVDGLKANDGIFMIASTNHLDQLDPGIAKRPSRFDRKYFFPDPNLEQRESYCHFWQKKLKSNDKVEFPDALCTAIAKITDKFSFAYMQEAFVASLLAMARDGIKEGVKEDSWVVLDDFEQDEEDDELNRYKLWVEMKKQVEILRQGIDEEE